MILIERTRILNTHTLKYELVINKELYKLILIQFVSVALVLMKNP